MCSSCHGTHQASTDSPMLPRGEVGNGPAWCYACHASDAWYDGTYPDPEVPDRNAVGYPVAGTWLGPDAYADAGNAHRLIPETTQTAGDGGEVGRSEGDCLYCHSAHRGVERVRCPACPVQTDEFVHSRIRSGRWNVCTGVLRLPRRSCPQRLHDGTGRHQAVRDWRRRQGRGTGLAPQEECCLWARRCRATSATTRTGPRAATIR